MVAVFVQVQVEEHPLAEPVKVLLMVSVIVFVPVVE
jgi:hypothetical protein